MLQYIMGNFIDRKEADSQVTGTSKSSECEL